MVMQGDSDEKSRQITCPGCLEEMARAELVGKKCPLCGYSLTDQELGEESVYQENDEELTWMLIQNLQRTIMDWLTDLGAPPMTAYKISYRVCCLDVAPEHSDTTTAFAFSAKMTPEERQGEKLCKRCGRTFVTGGRKIVSGDLFEPETETTYYCEECKTAAPRV